MARFDSAIALALRLIDKNGEDAQIVRKTDGAPEDSDKPWKPGDPETDEHDVRAVFLDYDVSRIDGELVKRGDLLCYVSPVGLEVVPDASTDTVVRESGETWAIVSVETLSPNGQLILHTLQLRK